MSRHSGVCCRTKNGAPYYYAQVGGKQVGLGRDHAAAVAKWHELMTAEADRAKLVEVQPALKVRSVLLAFLEYVRAFKSERTFEFHHRHLAGESKKFVSFDEFLCRNGNAEMLVTDFGPLEVESWINQHFSSTSANYRHNLMRSVCEAFSWAIKKRPDFRRALNGQNPLIGLEKPVPTARQRYITDDEWQQILAAVEDGPFRDILIVLAETGCRPQELRMATAENFQRAERRLYFDAPIKKTRGKSKPRVILLTDVAYDICLRLALKHPEGLLFRNEDGGGWTRNALNLRCRRLSQSSKRKAAKLPFKFTAYDLRHRWCTNALKRGVDPLTVATLMGHSNASMVMSVYQKLSSCGDHLRDALLKATG